MTRLKKLPLQPYKFLRNKIWFSNLYWPPSSKFERDLFTTPPVWCAGFVLGPLLSPMVVFSVLVPIKTEKRILLFAVARMADNSLSGRRV